MSALTNEQQKINIRNQAIDWLIKLRDVEISETEQHQLADWLAQDAEHSAALVEAESLFRDMQAAAETLTMPLNLAEINRPTPQALRLKSGRDQTRSNRPRLSRAWLYPAFAMAASCLLAINLLVNEPVYLLQDLFSDFHTAIGEQQDIQLSDGSRLLLNTNSAVSVEFSVAARQVILHHGQVRFMAAQDASRPFEVTVDHLTIKALGTIFEVYKNTDKETSVIVQEHKVSVTVNTNSAQQAGGVTIPESYQFVYRSGQPLQAPEAVKIDQLTAWQAHKVVINDRPLSELIAELQRYRRGRIFLADKQIENLRITGIFSLNNPDDALHSICKAMDLQEKQIGPWWTLLYR